jgi:glycosyltransferase involved in cell wall biosynthesis
VIESMACGTPVLCQRGQGPGEIVPYDELMTLEGRVVREGKTRLLHADTGEAASVLMRAASSPSLLSSLAERGRRAVESVYRIGRIASRWRDCIREYS